MRAVFKSMMLAVPLLLLAGCEEDQPMGGYVSASSFSKKGFAKNRKQALANRGKVLKVWGYVDGSNVFPEGTDDNQPEKWRFHLKAKPGNQAGESFAIHIPVDDGHDKLVALSEANDRAGKPTRVFVTGIISTFDAPGNFALSTGLFMNVNSSKDILLKAPTEK